MKLHYSLNELKGIRNPVVTTGIFDGVHIGHKTIIQRLIKLARDINGETVLITFHPHPRRVLYPDSEGKDLLMILSQKEKIDLLGKTGLDHLVILKFTREFSKISSFEFVEDILVKVLQAKIVVVGFNHHFGHNRQGDFAYLYNLSHKHGFEVEEIPEQDLQNEAISSTKIRNSLMCGNVQRANAYLDHLYTINGKVSLNEKTSEIMSLPMYSIEIEEDIKLVPADGLYAVSIEYKDHLSKGMVFIEDWEIVSNALNPGIKVGINIFDKLNIPDGSELIVYFQKKILDILKVNDTNRLKKELVKYRTEIEELIY